MYRDADSGQLLSSICTSLQDLDTEEFYGAVCMDLDMIQGYLSDIDTKVS